jgi:hypothetical protein
LEDARLEPATEFTTPGDEMLTDFNLYYLGVVTNQGEGLVDLEIESIRVLLPEPAGATGDFNNNGVVDAADYVLWRNGGELANEGGVTPGMATPEDFAHWRAHFGETAGGGASAGQAAAVPEPSICLLCGIALGILGARLRQVR